MKNRRVKNTSYISAVERRIHRFYMTFIILGVLTVVGCLLVMPYLNPDVRPVSSGEDVLHGDKEPPKEGAPESDCASQLEALSNRLVRMDTERNTLTEERQLLRSTLENKERAFQELFDAFNKQQKQSDEIENQLALVTQKLHAAENQRSQTQARMDDMEEHAKAVMEKADQLDRQVSLNRTLMSENEELQRERDGALLRLNEMERKLAVYQDEAGQQKQTLAVLYRRMETGEVSDALLESVAMAQWRLLRYDAEWVMRTLSSATPAAYRETIDVCVKRLNDSLFPAP